MYNYNQKDFITANQQAKKLITLPIHQYLRNNQLDFMIKSIKKFYR